jgi:undecaprenyl-diphosphatase
MMTIGFALLLALIQGLTEFLPVSSSAHLSLLQTLSGYFKEPPILFDVWLHLATVAAVLVYYHKRLLGYLRPDRLFPFLTATVITGVIGLLLKHQVEHAFGSVPWVCAFLCCTGIYLFVTQRWARPGRTTPGFASSALVGLAQGIAVFPGLSRSGFTICTGLWMGFKPEEAAEFSFILSVPAVLGANGLEFWSNRAQLASVDWGIFAAAFAAAFLVGLGAIHLMTRLVARNRLNPFAAYCILAAAVAMGIYAGRTLS